MPRNPGRLSPLIERLKAWRTSNNLSQAQAVKILVGEGLPIALTTLQQWEIVRRSPQPVAVAALERFLARQEKSSLSRAQKTITPVIERLKAWREVTKLNPSEILEAPRSAGVPGQLHAPQPFMYVP